MAVVRELVTKLTTKADTSGFRAHLRGLATLAKAEMARARASEKLDANAARQRKASAKSTVSGATASVESKANINRRTKLALLGEEIKLQQQSHTQNLTFAQKRHSDGVNFIRQKATELKLVASSRNAERIRLNTLKSQASLGMFKNKAREVLQNKQLLNNEKLRTQALSHRMKLEHKANMQSMRARRQSSSGFGGGGGGGGIGIGGVAVGNVIASGVISGMRTAVDLLKQLGTGLMSAGSFIEDTKTSFGVLTGSVEVGNDMIRQMQKLAADTPLVFKSLSTNVRTLLGYRVPAEKVIDLMKQMGDVTGGDEERLGYMTYGMAQVISMGRLQGQELRQLINAGFNPLSEISRTTGKSMEQLKVDMENGAISSQMVEDAFKSATSEGGNFYMFMEKMSQTLSGRFAKLNDEIFLTAQSIGGTLLPIAKGVLNELISFASGAGKNIGMNIGQTIKPAIMAVIGGFERLARAVFDFKTIGDTLANKDKLSAFFKDLAKKIDAAFVWITAAVLEMKKFFAANSESIVEGLTIIAWAIKEIIANLPFFIKAWAGLKLWGIVSQFSALGKSLLDIWMNLQGLTAEGMKALAMKTAWLALGAAIAVAFVTLEKFYRLLERDSIKRDVDKQTRGLKASVQDSLDEMKFLADKRNEIKDSTSMSASQKATELQGIADRMELIRQSVIMQEAQIQKLEAKVPTGEGLLDTIQGVYKDFVNNTPGSEQSSTSFQKSMEQAKATATPTTQNININVTSNTDVKGDVASKETASAIAESTAQSIAQQFNARFNNMWSGVRVATTH